MRAAAPRPASARRAAARPRAHDRHAALLEAAARKFRKKGCASTALRNIAATSGMTAGSIDDPFSSRGSGGW